MGTDPDLVAARRSLRERQGAHPTRARSVTAVTLEEHRRQTAWETDATTGRWRRGAFTFEPALESTRIALGESIIRRVDPAHPEDPNYFAMIARHAASIELALAARIGPDTASRFVIGTLHESIVNAFSMRTQTSDFSVIGLHSGLIDFVYQAAKCVIAAGQPRRTRGAEKGLVTIDWSPGAIRQNLAEDPEPADRLRRTLEAYYYYGYPRAAAFEVVPDVQHPALAALVMTAERFTIAHEYGHRLVPEDAQPLPGTSRSHTKEYLADAVGLTLAVQSAKVYDAFPPDVTLSGAAFALCCLEVLNRSYAVAKTGDEAAAKYLNDSHPPPLQRAERLVADLRAFFEMRFYPDHTNEMWSPPRPGAPPDSGLSEDRAKNAYLPAEALMEVWAAALPALRREHDAGRALHPVWT